MITEITQWLPAERDTETKKGDIGYEAKNALKLRRGTVNAQNSYKLYWQFFL